MKTVKHRVIINYPIVYDKIIYVEFHEDLDGVMVLIEFGMN